MISQNPAAFMNLILAGDPNAGLPSNLGNMGGGAHHHGSGSQNPGQISVSQEEMEAIERLASLGFTKHKAAEAYFSCDKNEEMAANFLFEMGGMEDDEAMSAAIQSSLGQQNPPNPGSNPG